MKNSVEIDGWFNYDQTFDFLINSIPDNGIFLEGGAWLGQSSTYLCDKIQSLSKNINVFILDTWQGSKDELTTSHKLATTTDIYNIFLENMGTRKFTPLRMSSLEGASKFENESLDVVFIDMCHTYEDVKQDIEAWYPKVKNNGYIAGHDYNWIGVSKAVNEKFSNIKEMQGSCWVVQKTEGEYNG
jgi:predicted O-methyltransferase YrrM